MRLTRTIKLKLDVAPETLSETFQLYYSAFDYVAAYGWEKGKYNKYELHSACYQHLRTTLPAQLCISAIGKASEALKSAFVRRKHGRKATCPKARKLSIRLDHRSYNIWFDRNICSILLSDRREKFSFAVPEYFQQYLPGHRRSAELFTRKGKVFLHIVFDKDVEDVEENGTYIGVDRGIKNLAVTSTNEFYGGGEVLKVVNRYARLRKALQQKGTKSAKRHLKRISLKENRFVRDTNHRVSKQIVAGLGAGDTLVLEDLKGIRDNSKKFRKKERGLFNRWSFFQLETFLGYKAKTAGCSIVYVDPRYTSQKCSKCGNIRKANRKSQCQFVCNHCGFSLHADLNAARNISQNHRNAISYPDRASVNRPIVTASASYKPTASAVGS